MIKALTVYGKKVPTYLSLIHTELVSRNSTEKAVFSMYCFWQGEIDFSSLDKVSLIILGIFDKKRKYNTKENTPP